MNETRALMPLLRYAVDVSLELLNASHGFIVLFDRNGHFAFPVARDNQQNTILNPEDQVSRKILYRVKDEKNVIITASAVTDEDYEDSESVMSLQIKSVICLPLMANGDVLGAMYVENRNQSDVFSKEQTQPLAYLAGHAALCIKNAILENELEELYAKRVEEVADTDDVAKAAHEAVKQERNRLLYGFIQDTSHHFRTPLAIIKNAVDLLKRKVDQNVAGDYLQRIVGQVDTIVMLVDALNLLVKMDADLDHEFVKENLSLLLHDMRDGSSHLARQKNIRIELNVPETPLNVPVMQEYARYAINRVLQNAIAYTERGGTVTLKLVDTPSAAHIIISDNGIGIPDDELNHVTKRFYQVDKSGTKRGLGVGLSIAERAMVAHHGELIIESELSVGTTVTLVFPKRNEGDE